MKEHTFGFALALTLPLLALAAACSGGSDPAGGSPGGTGGVMSGTGGRGTGGAGSGGTPATGGVSGAGMGGSGGAGTGGSGTGGAGSGGSGGQSGSDAAVPEAGGPADVAGDRPAPGPSAPGQGPTAEGMIVFSQDFERDMVGMNRGPRAVPPDRVTIVDDPLNMRGKVLKVVFQQGDNFRTSPGTEPRTWVSNRDNGHEFPPGTKVSHAFGIMTDKSNMNYCFAQVISTGGPVWMLIGGGDGRLTVFCNACGDANTMHFQIEPNKWHDFRVDMDFRTGGSVRFFHNGTMFRQSTLSNTRGNLAHWDGGIYNRPAGTGGPTRTVYIGNLSVGVRP